MRTFSQFIEARFPWNEPLSAQEIELIGQVGNKPFDPTNVDQTAYDSLWQKGLIKNGYNPKHSVLVGKAADMAAQLDLQKIMPGAIAMKSRH